MLCVFTAKLRISLYSTYFINKKLLPLQKIVHLTPNNVKTRKMRYIILLIALLTTTLNGLAQSRESGKYLASYLNMASGMPTNYADDIFQDSYGFMWISTHTGGLVRYDGYKMMGFGYTASPAALRSNSTRNVAPSPRGTHLGQREQRGRRMS